MENTTITELQFLNTLKHRVRDMIRALDKAGRIYPGSLEAAQVKHEVGVLLSELQVHGLLPANVHLGDDLPPFTGTGGASHDEKV